MSSPDYKVLPFKYVHPGEVMAAGIVLPLVCMIVVALRFHCRKIQKAAIGIDDWLTLPALLLITGMGICFIIGVAKKVYGYPTTLPADATPENETTIIIPSYEIEAKIEFAFQLLMILAYGFIKLSVVFFCRRIFNVMTGTVFHFVSTLYIVLVIMWTLGFFLLFLFGCKTHISAHWTTLEDTTLYCGNALAAEMALVCSDFITDLMVFFLPLPMIWRLNTTLSKKIAVSSVFCVGSIAIVCSIVRLSIYVDVSYRGYTGGYDLNQTVTTMLWWSMLEASLGLITACMPSLRALIRKSAIQSMINSIRGMVSLRSTNTSSAEKWTAPRSDPYSKINVNVSTSSEAPIYIDGNGRKVFAMTEGDGSELPHPGKIHVKHGIDQEVFSA